MKDKVNEIKISYKEKRQASKSFTITSSKDAAKLFFEHWNSDTISIHESFKVMLLNNSNKVKAIFEVSTGGITGTVVDIRILFAVVLKSLSVGIILAHNHPSGKLKPSKSDIQITSKIKSACDFLDIKILDHLILTPHGEFYSFSDNHIL